MYPLNELNNKFDELKKDIDWAIDHVRQTWEAASWLVCFAKRVEPYVENLDKISVYAEIIPGLQAVIEDLRLELRLKDERQHNTALIYGKVTTINVKANPPRIEVRTAIGNVFIVEVQGELFDVSRLKIASTVKIEARIKNHFIQKRGIFTIFNATDFEVINSGTVDKVFEGGYNDN